MTMQQVTLTGDALNGVMPYALQPKTLAALPQRVKLGRRRPKAKPPVLKLKAYHNLSAMVTPPPASINRRDKAAEALARMYLNDTWGCCVIAGKAHGLAIWSANSPDNMPTVQATDDEILSQYHGICGPGDNGCNITQVLDVMRSKGFQAGGKLYKIDGYVAVDHTNKLETQVCQLIYAANTVGINLPNAWLNEAVWDVTTSHIIGGHDVTPIDYDEKGVYVSSWGRVYLMTWLAWQNTKWIDEYYAILDPMWYGSRHLAICGIDADALKADLVKLSNGIIPDIGPSPVPPPTPTPVPPPAPVVDVRDVVHQFFDDEYAKSNWIWKSIDKSMRQQFDQWATEHGY